MGITTPVWQPARRLHADRIATDTPLPFVTCRGVAPASRRMAHPPPPLFRSTHISRPMPPARGCGPHRRNSQERCIRPLPTPTPRYPSSGPPLPAVQTRRPIRGDPARLWPRRQGPASTWPRRPGVAAGGIIWWNIIPTSPAPRQVFHELPSECCLQRRSGSDRSGLELGPAGEQQLPPARSEMSMSGVLWPRGQIAAASPIQPNQGDDARCWQCVGGGPPVSSWKVLTLGGTRWPASAVFFKFVA